MLRFARETIPCLARRVLIVESDQSILKPLCSALMLAGYDVLCAADLAKAAAQLVWQPDFILVDPSLPDGSGLELLPRIRRRNDTAMVAVVGASVIEDFADVVRLRPDAIFRIPSDLSALLEWLDHPVPLLLKPPVVRFCLEGA